MKYKLILFLLIFVGLGAFLQLTNAYNFYYIEQNQLFVYSWMFDLQNHLTQIGGLSEVLNAFLSQFFIVPFMGAIITAAILTSIYVLIFALGKRVAPNVNLYFIAFIPVFFLLLLAFDFYYLAKGTIAYLFVVIALYFYSKIFYFKCRLACATIGVLLLFMFTGSAANLFAVCVIVYELLSKNHKKYILAASTAIIAGAVSVASVYFLGEYRYAFLPDLYYYNGLKPPFIIYLSWISLPLVFVINWVFRHSKGFANKTITLVSYIVQIASVALIVWLGYGKVFRADENYLMKLNYLTSKGHWDEIISSNKDVKKNNSLYLSYLNMALAEKGILAEYAFMYEQVGISGIKPQWDQAGLTNTLLSDIYFSMGNVAMSQAMAFESNLNSRYNYNPRMLQRLVQTNLITGSWAVAEKYMDILNNTLFYRKWAKKHYKLLYNDVELEKNTLLNNKRKHLVDKNYLTGPWDARNDLFAISQQNPNNKISQHYLGISYLLMKDVEGFEKFIETFYNSDKSMPKAFQEATAMIYIDNPEKLNFYKIPRSVASGYNEFRNYLSKNLNNPNLFKNAAISYGNTYWFYYTKKI